MNTGEPLKSSPRVRADVYLHIELSSHSLLISTPLLNKVGRQDDRTYVWRLLIYKILYVITRGGEEQTLTQGASLVYNTR